MGIKHTATKVSGESGYAIEWNDDHIIDSDVDFNGYSLFNVQLLQGTGYSPLFINAGGNYVAFQNSSFYSFDSGVYILADGLDMGGFRIVDLAEPVLQTDAATKDYVDNAIFGGGTSYYTITGYSFFPNSPDTEQYYRVSAIVTAQEDGVNFQTDVNLPNGAIVTACVVYGNAAAQAEVWSLVRTRLTDSYGVYMARANIGTENTTISNATIDNSTYVYSITTSSLDDGDAIYGARITYIL